MMRLKAAGKTCGKLGSLAGWRSALLGNASSSMEDFTKKSFIASNGNYSGDLGGLLALIGLVRRRFFANRFLGGWLVWLNWALLTFIAAAAFSRQLKYVVISAVSIAAIGVIVSFVWGWWRRPSPYYCACATDRASGLSDRLSTALYFGSIEEPDAMMLRQRRDATNQVGRIEPRSLFPVRMPDYANRTLVLALIATGLLAYRLYYNPPMMALLQRVAASHVERTVLSPLAGAVKKEFLALVNRDQSEVKDAAADAETVPGLADPKQADDASQLGDKDGAAPGDMQDDSESSTAGAEGEPGDPQGERAECRRPGRESGRKPV